ncbi:PID-CTERM protein-sorting domain-containing protein [Hymenobacter sp. IS2118]|uniref:PID-CTERM protein-sorting domain-containing protein n=1 Tax=Hymenobacter sp. IS2118 TaxID=1505605 RepID=UPI0009DE728A|nr:hypothetical protein [Hymenobacter sp. IS2118]
MKRICIFLLVLASAAMAQQALAQPSSGGPRPGDAAGPTTVPIDGGVSLLLASGAAYGLRRLRPRRIS